MKKLCVLGFALLSMPLATTLAWADEIIDDEAEPVAEEAAPVEEAPPAEPVEEEVAAETPVEEEEAPAEPADEGEPWILYGGLDRADIEVSFSDEALQTRFGCVDCGSRFWRARVGTRVFDFIGLEAHYGFPDEDGQSPGEVEVDSYMGFFAVPTGSFLDLVEISVPIGYSMMTLQRPGASEDFERIAFGMNIEVPIIIMKSWVPEIRVGGGGMVYQAENHARVYGWHMGLRLDFAL